MAFHHTCILTGQRDLAAACERYYCDHFGMGLTFASVTDDSDYCFYADNSNADFSPFEIIGKAFDEREFQFLNQNGPGLDHVCFKVDDIQQVYEKMTAAGVVFHVPPYRYADFMLAWCHDPCGVEVELLQADIEFPTARYKATAPRSRYHHIGILAGSPELADKTAAFYRKMIGLQTVATVTPPGGNDRIYLQDKSGAMYPWIEIVATACYPPEKDFLERRGPGLQHHCLVVEDADAYARFLQNQGVALGSEIVESNGSKTFFLLDPAKVCVQILQMPADG